MSKMEAWEGQPAWEWAEQATRLSLARRTATHWWEASGVEARSLLKLYGIRFDVIVTGQVGGARWDGQSWGGRRRPSWSETQPRCLSGREVWAHPHDHHFGHRSSLAGRGECGQCGLLLAADCACPDPPACTLSPLCLLLSLGERVGEGGRRAGWGRDTGLP